MDKITQEWHESNILQSRLNIAQTKVKKKNPERCMNIKTSSEVFSATNNTAIITLVISLCYSQYPVKLCVFEICAKIVNSLGVLKNKNRFLRIKVSKFDD